MDEQGHSLPIPQFVPETAAEVARFREGTLRREFRRKLVAGAPPLLPVGGEKAPDREMRLYIQEFLKLFPRRPQFPWESAGEPSARARDSSYVHRIEPVRGGETNFIGTLYGGTLMRWVESSASLSARAYLGNRPVRFAGLHGLTFLKPIFPKRFVHIRAVAVHSSEELLTLLINVQAEDPLEGSNEDVLRAFLSYSPSELGVKPQPVMCNGDEERSLFEEVEHRLALQRLLARE